MTQPLYLSYFSGEGLDRRGLSIYLEQDRHERPPHEWLRDLHAAADGWRQKYPDIFLRSELGVEPEPGCRRVSLPAYLYASGEVNGPRLGRHLTMLRETGTIHRFTVRPGAPVEGADLIGREVRIADLLRILETGSCHLRAPRRYGKTSLLRHLMKLLSAGERPCVYADISPGRTASWFLVTLARATMDSVSARSAAASLPELAGWPEREARPLEKNEAGERLRQRIAPNSWSFGRRFLESLGDSGAVLLLDEFSVFLREAYVQNPEEARQIAELLATSRRNDAPISQVLAGSAGLTSYLRFHGLEDLFSDLTPLDLPPLTTSEAAVLVEELLYGERQAPSLEAIEEILEAVGEPVPYFLHAVVNAVLEENLSGDSVTPEVVNRAYTERLLGTFGNDLFKVYSLRDRPYPAELHRGAARLLRELALRPEGVEAGELRRVFIGREETPLAEQFEPLLSCLQEDYDLVERHGLWTMRSKVLRDRWALRDPVLAEVD